MGAPWGGAGHDGPRWPRRRLGRPVGAGRQRGRAGAVPGGAGPGPGFPVDSRPPSHDREVNGAGGGAGGAGERDRDRSGHGHGGRHEVRQVPRLHLQLRLLGVWRGPHRHRRLRPRGLGQGAGGDERLGLQHARGHHHRGRHHLLHLLLRLLRCLEGELLHGHHVRHPAQPHLPGGGGRGHRWIRLQGQGALGAGAGAAGGRAAVRAGRSAAGGCGRAPGGVPLLRRRQLHGLGGRGAVQGQRHGAALLLPRQRHRLQRAPQPHHRLHRGLPAEPRSLDEEEPAGGGRGGLGHRLLRGPGHHLRLLPHEGHPQRLRGHVEPGDPRANRPPTGGGQELPLDPSLVPGGSPVSHTPPPGGLYFLEIKPASLELCPVPRHRGGPPTPMHPPCGCPKAASPPQSSSRDGPRGLGARRGPGWGQTLLFP